MKDQVEILVIGSGFGGAIAAKRLAQAGRDVLMLERGPWRDTVPNRSAGMVDLAPLPQGIKAFTYGFRSIRSHLFRGQLVLNVKGFVEAYRGKGINVICSSNVGGGSHIYAGMLAKPSSPAYWDGRHPQISQAGMDKYYAEIIALLQTRAATEEDKVPNRISETNYGGKLSTADLANPLIGVLFPKEAGSASKITDAYGIERWECDYRNNSVLGSPSGAKTTLDFSFVWPAIQHGLIVRDLCEVQSIRKLKDIEPDGMRYAIDYRDHRSNTDETIMANHVILAAGCLNTTRLLFKSRDIDGALDGMPRLGLGFGTNGGFFAFWKENSSEDLSEGLPLGGPFRSANSSSKSAQVLRAAIQGIDSIPMPAVLRRWLCHNSFIVALGKDNNNGRMEMRHGKFRITYDKKESSVYQEIDYEVNTIQRATGTKIYAPRSPVTVQPLGGACLGTSNDDGVIDANGEIFDNPGLYVADAAALPESPGRPPSLTIAVWAAHVADRLIERIKCHGGGAMEAKIEIAVIGSGFGGSIAARRLAEAGCKVVMLERGPWRDTVPNRSLGIKNLAPLPQGAKMYTHGFRAIGGHFMKRECVLNKKGFAEAYLGKGINVICTSNVGGGSHVFAGILGWPGSPTYWDNRHPEITQERMGKYYDEILGLFQARPITRDDMVPNLIEQTDYQGPFQSLGAEWMLPLAIRLPEKPGHPAKVKDQHGAERWECDMRNNSFLGSPSGGKTTLDFSFIWPAMQHGPEVRDLCEARSIRKLRETNAEGMRYEILYRNHREGRDEKILAKHVVLAAGCLNTIRLLLKSRDVERGLDGMPRLGMKFGGNGDFFGIWKENSSRDLSEGLPINGPFRLKDSINKTVLVLRSGLQGLDAVPMPSFIRRWLQKQSVIIAFGGDGNTGTMALERGKFKINYKTSDNDIYREIDSEIKNIQAATGTKVYAPGSPVTVHPIGGACLGTSNADGVIDASGEIFDNPGLYVADAAALPESPGGPPSLTIAVWSANVADRLIAKLENT